MSKQKFGRLMALLVKTYGQKADPEPAHMPSPVPSVRELLPPIASLESKPKTKVSLGWFLLLLGLAGLAWFPYRIIERRACFSFMGYEEYTIQDNLLSMGPMVLLSVFFAIIGLGVICRWRWATGIVLIVGSVLILLAWIVLNL